MLLEHGGGTVRIELGRRGDDVSLAIADDGVFVVEASSVMLQVAYFKYTARRYGSGKRLFKMAPLHHHFEKSGWSETKIIFRFWILGVLCSLIAFSTLKIR